MRGMRCYICGKGAKVGRQVSHSGVRTRRIFKPNLHWKKVDVGGVITRIKMCTKCMKRMKKNARDAAEKVTQVTSEVAQAPTVQA